ncbi:MAG: N-acetyltransferase family protein [Haloarculaceae archaeon]
MRIRRARADDYDDVASFTGPETTWPDRDVADYLPEAFPRWVASDDERQRTFVAEREGTVVGLVQGALLTAHEGWAQGIRVAPTARGAGVGTALTEAVFEWARERGRSVVRNLVFGWNAAGMAQSRRVGFEPCASLRWVTLDPSPGDPALAVGEDADGAWLCWADSDARPVLGGLGFDFERSWALAECTRDRLHRAAADERVFAVERAGRTRAMAYRARTFERDGEAGQAERWAEYGASAWVDAESARSLLTAVAADAAALGADRARVAVPETARHLSDAAGWGGDLSENASFVFAAEL